jgi:predicted Zn finger-like uncharacterized protein
MPNLILDCPSCSRKLRVPEDLLGKPVKCPTCGHVFEPATPPTPSPGPPALTPGPEPSALTAKQAPDPTVSTPPSNSAVAAESVERVSDRRCPHCGGRVPAGAENCASCGHSLVADEGREEEGWDDPDRYRGRLDAEPHRGAMVLTFGILSIVLTVIGLPFGIAALVMGKNDLAKMRRGAMDRRGQETTKAGWICGIIGTILQSFACLGCMVYIAIVTTVVAGAASQMRTAPRMAPPPTTAKAPLPPLQEPTPVKPLPDPVPKKVTTKRR